jgi:P27 family predicted phage terminase small subunit
MAIRGAKPKPVCLKRIAGNPGKRSLATMVPEPREGELACPPGVAGNERALAYWEMYLDNAAPGHLAPLDAPLLARLCLALAYADEATEKIAQTGMLVKAPNTGLPIQSPYMAVLNRQTEIARKLASELALPPAQRNRMGLNDTNTGDGTPSPWDEFITARDAAYGRCPT